MIIVKTYKIGDLGTKNKFKGKWNHFTKKDFIRLGLEEYYYKSVDSIDIDKISNTLIQTMQKEKFVFFEDVEVRPILTFGKLKEVWINYWHIN